MKYVVLAIVFFSFAGCKDRGTSESHDAKEAPQKISSIQPEDTDAETSFRVAADGLCFSFPELCSPAGLGDILLERMQNGQPIGCYIIDARPANLTSLMTWRSRLSEARRNEYARRCIDLFYDQFSDQESEPNEFITGNLSLLETAWNIAADKGIKLEAAVEFSREAKRLVPDWKMNPRVYVTIETSENRYSRSARGTPPPPPVRPKIRTWEEMYKISSSWVSE